MCHDYFKILCNWGEVVAGNVNIVLFGLVSVLFPLLYLAVQGTLKSLLQHQSSKASILQHSAFFTTQLSHPYMTTAKTRALTG